MWDKVPFLGESRIHRAEDEEREAKNTQGQAIDEVMSTFSDATSWDDVAIQPPVLDQPVLSISAMPHASVAIPVRRATHTQGAALKKAIIESNYSVGMSWIPINNGHGLRINILGNMDAMLSDEWSKMIETTSANNIGQFEFNLTQAPSISLAGIGMLLLFKEQKGSARGDIKLCHCNREVWQLLQWTGMDKYFVIQGGPNMAINS
jgi:anti-anti-sigma factor